MTEQSILSVPYRVRSYEASSQGVCTLHSISNYLQEAAGNHARQLQFDIEDLGEENQTWVLQRLIIDMSEYPKWRDQLNVKTWPSGTDGIRAYRDFELTNSDGQRLGAALSYWMIIDLDTRRPVRVPKALVEHRAIHDQHILPVKDERLKFSLGPSHRQERYIIQPSDIDVNQHVNNAVYIRLIEDMLYQNLMDLSDTISQFDISFLREAHLNDVIELRAEKMENHIQVVLSNQKKQELLKAELLLQ